MRAIICGAGEVGYNIAAYMARENNDITVIDNNPALIAEINNELDVNGIVGHASNPEVLEQAGARDADLIIAVTHSDEVNMVACQVAHSLFSVPKKIARIRDQVYLNPAWSNLFSRAHMPIDVIISPEIEVSKAIMQRLTIPGTTNVIPLADSRLYVAGVTTTPDCPVIRTQIRQIGGLFLDLDLNIIAIIRNGRLLIPSPTEEIYAGDEVYFAVAAQNLKRTMAVFGHDETEARRIVIMGGGNIGLSLARLIEEKQRSTHLKIIERNPARAQLLSERLESVIVLQGDGLDRELLEEAGIDAVETFVAITNDDEANILGSLLAKQYGCKRVITLVNKPVYAGFINALGIDTIVSPRATTVATIMQHVRRGRIRGLYSLRDGVAEVIEAEASETSPICALNFSEMSLPPQVVIAAIVRANTVIIPTRDTEVIPGDRVILLAERGYEKEVEKLFSVQVDLF